MLITEQVATLNTTEEYDINIWTDSGMTDLRLVFYPLLYPGDAGYPVVDLEHGLPVADQIHNFHVLSIPKDSRGPKRQQAIEYLLKLANEDSFDDPQFDLEFVEWTSCESVLRDAPALIREFQNTLPRRTW